MRSEFIQVLVGFISISTLSTLMSRYAEKSDKILIVTVVDSVGAGNFSYWELPYVGPLILELTSHTGDADLYVSHSKRPSYEVDQHNYSSATCGLETIYIPFDFPQPMKIGIFGDWSHAVSEYSLQVYFDKSYFLSEERQLERIQSNPEISVITDMDNEEAHRYIPEKTSDDEAKLLRLFNVLDLIFEIFVF